MSCTPILLLLLSLASAAPKPPSIRHTKANPAIRQPKPNSSQCSTNLGCQSGRCASFDDLDASLCTTSSNVCFCVPLNYRISCETTKDCVDGTECYFLSNDSNDKVKTCLSESIAEKFDAVDGLTAAKVSDPKCVDASALAHLAAHELVFEKHKLADVLCDKNGSCATPGHIVEYLGKGMMMKSYCEKVACESKVIKVNSPRYAAGVRIESKTDGLLYTAFAAKYETFAEEAAMSVMVRAGL